MQKKIPEKWFCISRILLSFVVAFMVWREVGFLVGLASFFVLVSLPVGWWWNGYKDETKPGVYGVFLAGLVALVYFNLWYLGLAVVVAMVWVSVKRLEKRF